jgi:hypothetical protein
LISGKRHLKIKSEFDYNISDKILTFIWMSFSVFFIYVGIKNTILQHYFGIVLVVFGCLGLFNVYQDISHWKGKTTLKNFGLIVHITRMIGSYIATVTAFLVVNNTFLPNIIAWLLPAVLFAPLQVIWSKKYQVKKVKSEVIYEKN